ncbi:hypothetical protein KI387_016221 [Taxus chinensis]|uniref:BHLH domain-containing protein n=1 Tax=Taxus chinensis TaxID=29808 RepID=A0AA38GDF3_TAXCH|nr:hypothetical protein KI387_016221 [Taxus chinensis]
MDNQNKAMFCPNLPWQGSEILGLGSTVPHMQHENYFVPGLTSLKPLPQAAFFFETLKSTSAKYPNYQDSQMCCAESFAKPNSVGVGIATVTPSCEECKVGNVIEPSSCYSQALESGAPFLKFQASVIRTENHGENVQELEVCNGLLSEKTNLEPSPPCQKRFILFDQTGSTGRIIFHPSRCSMLLPNSVKPTKEINARSMDMKELLRSGVPAGGYQLDWEAGCSAYRETLVASAFAALQKTRADRLNPIFLGNLGDEFIPEAAEGDQESTSRMSYHGLRQERTPSSDQEMHEDTEDLEALLSSDNEESSTGHSPSDLTGNNGDTYVEDDFEDITSGISTKRRKMDTNGGEDEIDLIPASGKEPLGKLMVDGKCLSPDFSIVDTSSWEPIVQPEYCENVKDVICDDILLCSHSSYGIPDERSYKISGNEQIETYKCFSRQSGSCKKSRKEKIKTTVKVLRSMIPGGNGMDTAIVLDEAIQYVKVLQLKVKRLEANQQDVMK